ncbi:MAG: ornithine cyclodeaminase family protein [Paenirhodobacter sp.]|uniref:ornithine cyclodeaminase family protein n=1 Tax=Paenirhodobacter sp. TaxID=1965326 RepID=UPI003D0C2628
MQATILTYDENVALLSWAGVIAALRHGHRCPPPQQGDILLGGAQGQLLTRAAHIEGLGFAVKADSIFPGNARFDRPSVQGAVLLYDPDFGAVQAIIESRLVTQYKTAADSVLGALCLARPDSRRLLIMGAGAVAETLARAYDAAFPGLAQIAIWSRRPDQAEALVERLGDLRAEVSATTEAAESAGRADIISTATMARDPILPGDWVRPGTHVDLVGAFTPEMRESDDALVAKSVVYVDFMGTVMDRIGDVMAPIASGAIPRDHIRGDLYALLAPGGVHRSSAEQITLFKNGGGAHLDLMVAHHIAQVAAAARA